MSIIEAHKFSKSNHESIQASENCGCFYCGKIFAAREVEEWTDDGQTAMCPKCGIDSLLPDSEVKFDGAFLKQMHRHWFSK